MRRLPLILVLASGVAAAQPAEPEVPAAPPPDAGTPPVTTPPPAPPPEVRTEPVRAAPPPPAPVPEPPREREVPPGYEPSKVSVGGYLQPQYRLRQDSPAQFDQDGFRFARARLIAIGQTRAGNLELSATVEAEMQPQFALQDAYATLARTFAHETLPGKVTLDAGQMRVPISRQQMLSDSRLSFVDKAQVATIAPDRDLGARLSVAPPVVPLRLIGGVFNGEGKNQVENLNQSALFVGRLEVSPFGRDLPLQESAFNGTLLTLGVSYGHNKLTRGNGHEVLTYLGADLAWAYQGFSGEVEYLMVKHRFDDESALLLPMPFKANGWSAQLAYMLPVRLPPLKEARFELAARVEEIDRNDSLPITQAGDPNQSVREITGVLSYYLRMHSLKAQLAFSHFEEIEDQTSIGGDAVYDNDQLLLQVTYRLE